MANYPKKLMDPTEAALSAIQEALNVRDDEEQQAPPPEDHEIPLAGSVDALPQTEPAMPAFDEAIDLDDIDTRGHDTAAMTTAAMTLATIAPPSRSRFAPPMTTSSRSAAFCARCKTGRPGPRITSPPCSPPPG